MQVSTKQDPYQKKKQATQETLIDAAFTLFSRKGFHNTTTREISELAGVNELTLFRHFQSKNNLLSQVVSHNAVLSSQGFTQEALDTRDFKTAFRHFAQLTVSELEEKYPMIRLMMMEATSNPEIKQVVSPITVSLREWLVGVLQKGVREGQVRPDLDLPLVAQSFLWLCLSDVMTRADVGPSVCPFSSEAVINMAIEIFLRGITT